MAPARTIAAKAKRIVMTESVVKTERAQVAVGRSKRAATSVRKGEASNSRESCYGLPGDRPNAL